MPASAYSMRYSCAAKHLHIHRIHQGWLKMHESREDARGEVTQRWRVARGAKTLLALLIWVCLAADATHRRHSRSHTYTDTQTQIYFPRAADNVIRLGNRATTTTTTKTTITTGRSSVPGGASADCLAKYSADGATRHPPDQHNFRSRRGKGVVGQCVRSTWHKINNLSLHAAEMANLAPNTAEKHLRVARTLARRESQLESQNRNEATPQAPLFVSRTEANTFPVSSELFRRVSNAQLMRVLGRVSSAAADVDAACGESAQCSRYSIPPLKTGNS